MITALVAVCGLALFELGCIVFLICWIKLINQELKDHAEPVYPIDLVMFEEIRRDNYDNK